jgi:hypothetical protein
LPDPGTPARTAIDLRRAAEIGEEYHQRFAQRAAIGEILEQGRRAAIEYGEQAVLQPVEIVAVRIPHVPRAAIEIARRTTNLNDAHAGFRQPACEQQALAAQMVAVRFPDFWIFSLQVVGVLHCRTEQDVLGERLKVLKTLEIGLPAERPLQGRQQIVA